jgi:hypothetical protein
MRWTGHAAQIQNVGREPHGKRSSWDPTVYGREISNDDLRSRLQ